MSDVQSGLRLDELLREVQQRLAEVVATRGRMQGLLDAVLAVADGVELDTTLQRIAQAAVNLVDARFGALGVLAPDGSISRFIYVGLDEATRARMGALPEGKGLLGQVILGGQPLRLSDLGEHEASHAPFAMLLLATALAVGGLGLAWFLHVREPELPGVIAARFGSFYQLVRDKFRIDELYDVVVVRPLFALADALAWRVDQGLIDGTVNGAATLVAATSGVWRRFQTGNVQHYALSFLAGALLLLGYWIVG